MGVDKALLLEDQKIRERLFDVISKFPILYQARQGRGTKILNPFSSLQNVIREHINPLSLFLADLVEQIKTGMTYFEALDLAVNFAMKHRYRDQIVDAVKELQRIESRRPYFLNGLALYLDERSMEERAERLRQFHRNLSLWNQKYVKLFGREGAIDIIPWRIRFNDEKEGAIDGTYRYPLGHQLETFRRAFITLSDLLGKKGALKWYQKKVYREIKEEMLSLAELLFDYGYTVREILGGLASERPHIAEFLNDHLISHIEKSISKLGDIREISRHVQWIALLDYNSMIPFRTLYCRLSDSQMIEWKAREIEKQLGVKNCSFRRLARIFHIYQEERKYVLAYYLDFKFSRAFGDHFRQKGDSGFGAELTQRWVFKHFDPQGLDKDLEKEIVSYSSKGKREMVELLNLLIDSLSHPAKLRGKRVYVLGSIQSGSMGKVLIGILEGNIVALKEPKKLKDELIERSYRLLDYEGEIHSHVYGEKTHHENIVECFGIVQDEERRFLAIGYHPAENLLELIRKNWELSKGIPTEGRGLDLRKMKVITEQIIRILCHLKEKDVIHRDIKPQNVLYLVDVKGEISVLKLIDFGVALSKARGAWIDPYSNQIVGTLGYMAPEQVIRKAGYSSDLYSFGVVLYQLMTGRLPINFGPVRSSQDMKVQLHRALKEQRIPMIEANPKLKYNDYLLKLSGIIEKMLLIDPCERIGCEALKWEMEEFWKEVPEESLNVPILYENN